MMYGRITQLLGVSSSLCSTEILRSINIFFGILNFLLIYRIYSFKLGRMFEKKLIVQSLSLFFMPVMFFCNFIFYTDSGSTFWVLLMYYLSLERNHLSAALAGVIGVVFRQTNIIWVMFVAASTILRLKGNNHLAWHQAFIRTIFFCFKKFRLVLANVWGYTLVGIGFVYFVWKNGSITVGDKEHHSVHLHFAQIFYFFALLVFIASANFVESRS